MGEEYTWSARAAGLRDQLPPEVVGAIDAAGTELAADADVEAVISALHSHGLEFISCIAGLMAIKDVPLAEAKWLVHNSAALADGRLDRETAWAAIHEEVANL